MPKTGLSKNEWEERLKAFARKSFVFRRGQRPPAGSDVAKKITAIENCPSHYSDGGKNLFGGTNS